jgi:hypothetical protein
VCHVVCQYNKVRHCHCLKISDVLSFILYPSVFRLTYVDNINILYSNSQSYSKSSAVEVRKGLAMSWAVLCLLSLGRPKRDLTLLCVRLVVLSDTGTVFFITPPALHTHSLSHSFFRSFISSLIHLPPKQHKHFIDWQRQSVKRLVCRVIRRMHFEH